MDPPATHSAILQVTAVFEVPITLARSGRLVPICIGLVCGSIEIEIVVELVLVVVPLLVLQAPLSHPFGHVKKVSDETPQAKSLQYTSRSCVLVEH